MHLSWSLPLLFMLVLAVPSSAQKVPLAQVSADSTALIRFTLRDGSVVQGAVWEVKKDSLVIGTTQLGRVALARAQVQMAEHIGQETLRNGLYWFPNPHATRHLVGPSAIPLRKGEVYYQNTYLLLNALTVGVTDHVSIGAGIELLTTFSRASNGPIYFFTTKGCGRVLPKLHIGGAGLFLSIPGTANGSLSEPRNNIGAATAITTYGTPDNQVSAGVGFAYDRYGFGSEPVITLSTQQRFARKTAFISENWFFATSDETYYFLSYGLRFMGEKIAVDLAFINNPDIYEAIFIGIPFVSFVVKW